MSKGCPLTPPICIVSEKLSSSFMRGSLVLIIYGFKFVVIGDCNCPSILCTKVNGGIPLKDIETSASYIIFSQIESFPEINASIVGNS